VIRACTGSRRCCFAVDNNDCILSITDRGLLSCSLTLGNGAVWEKYDCAIGMCTVGEARPLVDGNDDFMLFTGSDVTDDDGVIEDNGIVCVTVRAESGCCCIFRE